MADSMYYQIHKRYLAYASEPYQTGSLTLELACPIMTASEDTELNDNSSDSISLARPHAWNLIAVFELMQMHFHRWWMSTARAVRLCQMMGLHLIDGTRPRPAKRMFPVAKDWTELEEQRRTFWMAFALDRYAAFGFGCPMIIDEKDVKNPSATFCKAFG